MNASQYFSDTLVWCLASGCAFWIGFKCSDLMRFFSASEIEKQFESTNIARTLTKWISLGIKLWMVEQRPGDIVISPSSVEGCGHIVMSFGSCLVHSAWNRGVMRVRWHSRLSYIDILHQTSRTEPHQLGVFFRFYVFKNKE